MTSLSSYCQQTLLLTANGKTVTATLEQNKATEELMALLSQGPLTLTMTENGGFEKIGNLPTRLTTSDTRQTAQSGDIMLYIGNVFCVFYGANTWSYTKLGKLDNISSAEIKTFLSGNPVDLTLSLPETSGINILKREKIGDNVVYDLHGTLVTTRPLISGFYIVDGKKTFIK